MATATQGDQQETAKTGDGDSNMGLYEGMFLLDSAKFANDPEGLTQHVLDIIEKAGGEVVAHRPWQDGKLAYEIEGHRKGLHFLAYYRMQGDRLRDMARSCKLSDVVLRHLVINQPANLFDAMVAALEGRGAGETDDEKPESPKASDSDSDNDDSSDDDSGDDDD